MQIRLFIITLVTLTACSGGGSKDDSSPSPSSAAPIVAESLRIL